MRPFAFAIYVPCQGLACVLVAMVLLVAYDAKTASLIIVPSEASGAHDGNSSFRPFDTPSAGRFQQVYAASSFASLPLGGGLISQLSFRIDANSFNSLFETITNIQINLSTISRAPDGLSANFADNVGPDSIVVLGPTSWILSGARGFDLGFDFGNQPFLYDPAVGNLLVDFQILAAAGGSPMNRPPLDAFDIQGDSVSSVFAFGATVPSTGQTSSLGLSSQFTITPVPEPSVMAIAAVVGSFCFVARRRKPNAIT